MIGVHFHPKGVFLETKARYGFQTKTPNEALSSSGGIERLPTPMIAEYSSFSPGKRRNIFSRNTNWLFRETPSLVYSAPCLLSFHCKSKSDATNI
jgi:hypothetical protein